MNTSKDLEMNDIPSSNMHSNFSPMEKSTIEYDETSVDLKTAYTDEETENRGYFGNFIDSFKPMKLDDLDPNMPSVERAAIIAERSTLKRSLKKRHVQMIAIGGCIGTGLFVGSGTALHNGGPASLVIAYFLVGGMIFCTVQSLSELAVAFPVAGSFLSYNSRFISPTWGFCMAWNYALQWLIVMPLELVAASLTVRYWNDKINSAAWVGIFYVVICLINICGVKGYGEAEFFFSTVKIVATLGFFILGIVINCGGAPEGGYIGGKYWHDPGAFNKGFKGLCSVFVTAAFSLAGTELVGLAAAEATNPRKTLPSATKQVFWRIVFFYMATLILVGCLVPYNNPDLLSSTSKNGSASPFVIAIKSAGITGLPSVMNVVILLALLSVGNAAVFACSRTLSSLAEQGFAPKIFGYVDRSGRPTVGIFVVLLVGLLCFLAATPEEATVFAWLMALSGLSSVFTWGSICFAHIRFRKAFQVQGHSLDELSFKAMTGVWGSYCGTILNVLILIAEFWVSLFPDSKPNAENFFQNYLNALALVGFLIFYLVWKKFNVIVFIRAKDIDIDSGRRIEDIDLLRQEVEEEKEFMASKPWYYRTYHFWC